MVADGTHIIVLYIGKSEAVQYNRCADPVITVLPAISSTLAAKVLIVSLSSMRIPRKQACLISLR